MVNAKKHTGLNRHQARESTLEVLYAWQSGAFDMADLPTHINDRLNQTDRQQQDEKYMREALSFITQERTTLDSTLESLVKRSLRSIAILELNILRIALWELQQRLEIPYRVIINEALELARDYSGETARGFINGLLDKMASQLRPDEFLKSQAKDRRGK
ncbi:MAG: transcription antitermination factor NusB [Mariprofundaceae bacterium]|nr:transcription antitermination factor NusB [Mariprofundaceae bacterium]